jgi:tetratricopeptide (TPR) repeat protein
MISSVELDERIGKCQKILEVDPNSQIFAALAEAYRKKGELDKAFRICQNGLKIHPSYGSAHVVMAKINLDRGLYDWAEAEAKKAAEVDGMTRTNELLLAEIYIYKGDFNRAISLLKKLSLADPTSSQIKKLLEIAQRIPEEQTRITGISAYHDDTPPEVEAATPESAVADQPVEELAPKELLTRAIRIPGIDGALFINHEGLVIDSEWVLKLDLTTCGAALGEIGNALSSELVKSSFGNFQAVLIETAQVTFYLIKKHDGLFLFVANESANLGTLRMKIENLLVSYR